MARSNVIIGAGIWGCSLARTLADRGADVVIIDKNCFVGGNCYSHCDEETGIEIHDFGSHILHTNDSNVWDFVNRFSTFNSYRHRVYSKHNGIVYEFPISIQLVNKFFGVDVDSSTIMEFLTEDRIRTIEKNFFDNYTKKQWGEYYTFVYDKVKKRIPLRTNYDTSYFNDTFQGVPIGGYGRMFTSMIDHKNIEFIPNEVITLSSLIKFRKYNVFYSGAVDQLFDYSLGALKWRSLKFENKIVDADDFQGCSVMNYPDECCEYTRIHEFKHYHPEKSSMMKYGKTCISIEYPTKWNFGMIPYYPVVCNETKIIYDRYVELLNNEFPNVLCGGRLGGYKYINMDEAIKDAVEIGRSVCL